MKTWAREDLAPARGAIEYRVSVDADSLTPQRIWEAQGRTRTSEELRYSLASLCCSLIEGNPRAWTQVSNPSILVSLLFPRLPPSLTHGQNRLQLPEGTLKQRPRMSSWKWSQHECKQKVSRGFHRAQSAAATQSKNLTISVQPWASESRRPEDVIYVG